MNEIADLPDTLVDEPEHFFKACNEITGKVFEPVECMPAAKARELIQQNR